MAPDLKKCLKAALLPATMVVIITIGVQLLTIFAPSATCCGLPGWIVELIILGWAGYRAVNEDGMDFVGGYTTGIIAAVLGGLVAAILSLVLFLHGETSSLMPYASTGVYSTLGVTGTALFGIAVIITFLWTIIIGAIEGAVCGGVGARWKQRTELKALK